MSIHDDPYGPVGWGSQQYFLDMVAGRILGQQRFDGRAPCFRSVDEPHVDAGKVKLRVFHNVEGVDGFIRDIGNGDIVGVVVAADDGFHFLKRVDLIGLIERPLLLPVRQGFGVSDVDVIKENHFGVLELLHLVPPYGFQGPA